MRFVGFVTLLALVVAAAAALRLPQLDRRVMHGDEAVHAVKFNELRETGRYAYDPIEYHGPTLYYAALPVAWAAGVRSFADTTETTLRLAPALLGIGLILLLPLITRELGRAETLVAAACIAVSPALVYYSRYFIQETPLVFFTFVAIVCGWRYAVGRRLAWAAGAGVALGAMYATKETCVIAYAALLIATLSVLGLRWKAWAEYRRAFAVAIPLAVVVAAALISDFFTHPAAILDSLHAYGGYFSRAGGDAAHDHPWFYYLALLTYSHAPGGPAWSEAPILLLATAGAVAAFASRRPGLRFIAVYTLSLTLIYSAIPYKTPWCLLGFLHGFALLAGAGAAALWRLLSRPTPRVIGAAALLVALGALTVQSWRANTRYASHWFNPYAYAHPVADAKDLATWLETLADVAPADDQLIVKVVAANPWPTPWLLRRLPHVGYWEAPPDDLADHAGAVVADGAASENVARLLGDAFRVCGTYGLRPNEVLVTYVRNDLWSTFAREQTP